MLKEFILNVILILEHFLTTYFEDCAFILSFVLWM